MKQGIRGKVAVIKGATSQIWRVAAELLAGYTLVAALAIAQTPVALPTLRLQGLDRLYFEHVGGASDPITVPPQIAGLLPGVARPARSGQKAKVKGKADDETSFTVRHFPLRLQGVARNIFIRQIVGGGESRRITELWWALYDDSRRSDVWYFSADPRRSESKALSNYEIETVSSSPEGGLELRVRGEMFRPQGAWWITGKVFSFSMHDERLTLTRIRNVFGFFHDYDLGDSPPATDVSTEREVDGGFEIRKYDSVPDGILRACGFRDPQSDDGWGVSWAEVEKTAICITGKPGARPSHRSLDEPSFAERGGGNK